MNPTAIIAILWADIIVFTIYISYILAKFGIPINLSITYYTFERRKKGTGILFPILMLFICCSAIPIWISTTYHASSWGTMFVCFPYITLVCLLAVAGSARYKRKPNLIYFHYFFAILAAISAVLWIFLVAFNIVYLGLGILAIFIWSGFITHTLKKCTIFWLEVSAFYAVFFTLLFIYLIPVNV